MMNYSIDARPTLELFFTTKESATFCLDANGDISAATDEDLLDLRSTPLTDTRMNADTKAAIKMARDHAAFNGSALSDYVFYN